MGVGVVGPIEPQTWLLIVVTTGQVMIAVDRWVHRQESKDSSLTEQASHSRVSLQAQIDTHELLRIERAAVTTEELRRLHFELDRLHQAASDEGDRLQSSVGHMMDRLTKQESRVDEIFRILERRSS